MHVTRAVRGHTHRPGAPDRAPERQRPHVVLREVNPSHQTLPSAGAPVVHPVALERSAGDADGERTMSRAAQRSAQASLPATSNIPRTAARHRRRSSVAPGVVDCHVPAREAEPSRTPAAPHREPSSDICTRPKRSITVAVVAPNTSMRLPPVVDCRVPARPAAAVG